MSRSRLLFAVLFSLFIIFIVLLLVVSADGDEMLNSNRSFETGDLYSGWSYGGSGCLEILTGGTMDGEHYVNNCGSSVLNAQASGVASLDLVADHRYRIEFWCYAAVDNTMQVEIRHIAVVLFAQNCGQPVANQHFTVYYTPVLSYNGVGFIVVYTGTSTIRADGFSLVDESIIPTATPTPTDTPTPAPTATPTNTPTPAPTATPTAIPCAVYYPTLQGGISYEINQAVSAGNSATGSVNGVLINVCLGASCASGYSPNVIFLDVPSADHLSSSATYTYSVQLCQLPVSTATPAPTVTPVATSTPAPTPIPLPTVSTEAGAVCYEYGVNPVAYFRARCVDYTLGFSFQPIADFGAEATLHYAYPDLLFFANYDWLPSAYFIGGAAVFFILLGFLKRK